VGKERSAGTETRRRGRGFAAGVATSDDDDVERFLHQLPSSGMRHRLEENLPLGVSTFHVKQSQFVSRETLYKK
jgi:hypothetical protein